MALVGRPNVGKSSLFNRITKSRKAIVDATPGVTRDRHYERVVWNEREIILVDTGGLEMDDSDSMVGRIQHQTWQAVEEADVIIFLLDGREGLSAEDYRVVGMLRKSQKPVYYVVNKIDGQDLEDRLLAQFYELGAEKLWPVSASHGYGVQTLLDHLVGQLEMPQVDPAVPEDTISLACFGRPNVGKSSLVNRLLGQDRMVVSDVPGTTRDAVDSLLEHEGKRYLLIDTAGIRRKGKVQEKLEKFSVMNALATLERCDVALVLIDAGEGITEQDTKVIGYCNDRGRACLLLINKWDLVKGDGRLQKQIAEQVERATNFVGFAPTLNISALTGKGVQQVLPTVRKVYEQYCAQFTTGQLNRLLQKAVLAHSPPIHKGRRVKMYYTTQVTSKPPTFVVFTNYPKGVHFSYHRYLVNQFRTGLGLDKSPLRILVRERERKKYG